MSKFNPKNHLMKMSGKDYLEVKWRQVWFREEHPNGGIVTDLANLEPALMYAKILDEEGRILGTGYGTPKKQGKAASRPFEGAETAAIGRALANAGFGTQFTGEEEGEHLADSPTDRAPKQSKKTTQPVSQNPEENTSITPQWVVDSGYSKSIAAAAHVINSLQIAGKPISGNEQKIITYRGWRETLEPKEAAEKTNAGEVPTYSD